MLMTEITRLSESKPETEPDPKPQRWVFPCEACGHLLGYRTRVDHVIYLHLFIPGGLLVTRFDVEQVPCPACGHVQPWYASKAGMDMLLERVRKHSHSFGRE